jgi:alkylation response protein AidB-like acyl-CoA dehydrogenase
MLVSVPLGIARGALDELARQLRDGRAGARRTDLAADPLALHDYAEAALRLEAARAGVRSLVGEAEGRAAAGASLGPRLLARLYLADLHATDVAVEVTSTAHRLGGGAAVHAGSRLLRALDDVHAARQHVQFAHEHRVPLGRVLAGVADRYPPYIT